MIAQEAEIEQIKAQEVILQDAIEDQKDKDTASVREEETPSIYTRAAYSDQNQPLSAKHRHGQEPVTKLFLQ